MGGCLSQHWKEWLKIGAEKWVLTVLREGYRVPFSTTPPLIDNLQAESFRTTTSKTTALQQEITQLQLKEAIEEAREHPGFFSHIFLVPKGSGGFRPVIDLSSLNTYVVKTPFKMETPRTVMDAIREGDWMVSVDLKDAYLQVPIHPDSRRYLRFKWKERVWQFRTLCFGLSTAPQVFTRLMAPVSAVMHRSGFRLLRYLDDWLLLASSQEEAEEALRFLLQLCRRLGIQVNWEKSSLQPAQERTFLGMKIQSIGLKVFPTDERLQNLCLNIESFLASPAPSAKAWLKLLGHMSSLIHLVPNSRRRMRNLQLHLHQYWDGTTMSDQEPVPHTKGIEQDLAWWSDKQNLEIGQSLQVVTPDIRLHTDASTVGWGASLDQQTVSGIWNPQEVSLHINLLELRAIRLALLHFTREVTGKAVALFTDNTTALAYLLKQGGTRSSALNAEAQRILSWTEEQNVTLSPRFIRGESNVIADSLSRHGQVLPTEWTLHEDICKQLWKLWGCPTVDLFATRDNFRLHNFVSPFTDPLALATDAFTYNWNGLDAYAYPPIAVVRKVLNKLRISQNTRLILIAPFWPQKEWFPDLMAAAVEAPRILPERWDLLRQPHMRRFHQGLHKLQLAAWRLSTVSSDRRVSQHRSGSSWQHTNAIPLL